LKELETIRQIVRSSPFPFVAFKPLTESHRAGELLSEFGRGKVIWVYRSYQDRANSAVAKFGSHNLEILRQFSQGKQLGIWQAQGVSEENIQLIKSIDYTNISPHEAAALFWYLRNALFFDQQLDRYDNAFLVAYEQFVTYPADVMEQVCHFLECPYVPAMSSGVYPHSVGRDAPPKFAERIECLCTELYDRLEESRCKKELELDRKSIT
jgi:hypothetical protein